MNNWVSLKDYAAIKEITVEGARKRVLTGNIPSDRVRKVSMNDDSKRLVTEILIEDKTLTKIDNLEVDMIKADFLKLGFLKFEVNEILEMCEKLNTTSVLDLKKILYVQLENISLRLHVGDNKEYIMSEVRGIKGGLK